jgi:hypothetical protein
MSALLAVVLVAGCSEKASTSLTEPRIPVVSADIGGIPCPQQFIQDPSCDPNAGGGGYSHFTYEYAAESDVSGSISGVGSTVSPAFCPASVYGAGIITTSGTGTPVPFVASGLFQKIGSHGLYPLDPTSARYSFPNAFFDSSNNPHIKVKASHGDAKCVYNLAIGKWILIFDKIYNVEWETRHDGTVVGGGGEPGQICIEEVWILEINYGDGTGWHEIWRGTVSRC